MDVKLKKIAYTATFRFCAVSKETNKKVQFDLDVDYSEIPEIENKKRIAWALEEIKNHFPSDLLDEYVLPSDREDVENIYVAERRRTVFPKAKTENNE